MIDKITTIAKKLFGTRAAGFYLLSFAIAIGVATFVENDYGTSSAQNVIFKARWFELLLALFGTTILYNIKVFRMVENKKWANLMFHLAIIVILIGAGVTRYFGYEGMMHIREGQTANTFLSSENFINFKLIRNGKKYSFEEPANYATLGANKLDEEYQIGNDLLAVSLQEFVPNPKEVATESTDGVPMLKVVIAGANGREEYWLLQGDKTNINGVNYNFSNTVEPTAFNIFYTGDSLTFQHTQVITQMVMATQTTSTLDGNMPHPLKLRSMYTLGQNGFVFGDFKKKGQLQVQAGDKKVKNESVLGARFAVSYKGQTQNIVLTGMKGSKGQPKVLNYGADRLEMSYGAKDIKLPFSVKCRDFILERYPGTDNPSSYASEVTLVDQRDNTNRDQRIFMNNVMDHDGYRFFQSSYDPDEAGTYLSVNHDLWGTWISYLGYILLTIGLAMTFFAKNTRFSDLMHRLKEFQTKLIFLIFSTMMVGQLNGQTIDVNHSAKFGKVIVQDHRGRLKPMNTLCNEVLRKISKKESLFGLTSEQILLSMTINPAEWEKKELIQVPDHPEIQKITETQSKLAAYASFFTSDGQYKLKDFVRRSQTMNPKDQGTFDKAIIKLDERINIANMIFSGRMFRLFPIPGDANNTWVSAGEIFDATTSNPSYEEIVMLYKNYALQLTQNPQQANQALDQITAYQQKHGSQVMPSSTRISSELILNKVDFFGKLRNYYAVLCLVFLFVFLWAVLTNSDRRAQFTSYAFYLAAVGFVIHTIGLGLRWYVSERAPWSNGYESMIYIGWTTMLAGMLFSRKSLGGLTATITLAATILLVASMSWLDPEITPLVPVLKSYWLTIHVSLEAGSYGFLMLGAVIGMLNLLQLVFVNPSNLERIKRSITELTIISEITLLGGLFMVSVGTYLGGVWANESWGRYWGWDAKETWALVTILVYAFILHMRFIPGLRGIYAFNFASLFGFATVIMTYFGVNYYLSGLHSYAAGDPVPIPPQVVYTAIVLVILSIVAYVRYRKVYK